MNKTEKYNQRMKERSLLKKKNNKKIIKYKNKEQIDNVESVEKKLSKLHREPTNFEKLDPMPWRKIYYKFDGSKDQFGRK